MPHSIAVLIAGLTMDASEAITPEMDTVKFGRMLETSMDRLNGVPGLYHDRSHLDDQAQAGGPNSLNAFKELARKGPPHGGQWDAHLIGVGLRRIPQLTVLFEELVNEAVVSSGGKAKLLFVETGNDHWEAVKRGFPDLDM